MFNCSDNWHWWLLILTLLVLAIVGRYQAKDLRSPEKELCSLRYSLILFGIVAFFLYVTKPFFFYYSYIPADFKTLEDAHEIIKDMDADINKLHENLEDFSRGLSFAVMLLIAGVLPAIYNFAKAIAKKDPEDDH